MSPALSQGSRGSPPPPEKGRILWHSEQRNRESPLTQALLPANWTDRGSLWQLAFSLCSLPARPTSAQALTPGAAVGR